MDNIAPGTLLQRFVDRLPEHGILLLSAEGTVTSWNTGAAAILGYSADEAIGLPLSHFHTKEDIVAGAPATAFADAMVHGGKAQACRCVRKGGAEVAVQSVLMPLYDQHEKLIGFGNLIHEMTTQARVAADPLPAKAMHEQVLVVDDNDEVRGVATNQLTSLGYRVIAVSSGAEALATLASTADIDLLFTDVVMPGGMNGREVADGARQHRPSLKVLFTSGYHQGALVRQGEIEQNVQFIVKPYRKKDLAEKVRAMLSGMTE